MLNSLRAALALVAALAVSDAAASPVVNPSFEAGLSNWSFATDGRYLANDVGRPTDGTQAAYIYSLNSSSNVATSSGSLSQTLDVSNVTL